MKKAKEPYTLKTEVKFRQQALFTFTSFLLLISMLFLVFQFSGNTLLVFFIFLIAVTAANYFVGKLFDIRIENKTLKIENMWQKFTIPADDLVDISLAHTIIPYPFNPYLKFGFKGRKPIVTLIECPKKIYFSRGGIHTYIADIKIQFSL